MDSHLCLLIGNKKEEKFSYINGLTSYGEDFLKACREVERFEYSTFLNIVPIFDALQKDRQMILL